MTNGASIEAPFVIRVLRSIVLQSYCIANVALVTDPVRLVPVLLLSQHCVRSLNGFVEQAPPTVLNGVVCREITGRAVNIIPVTSRISITGCTVDVTAYPPWPVDTSLDELIM